MIATPTGMIIRLPSNFNDQPVVGAIFGHVVLVLHHFAAEMGKDDSLGAEIDGVTDIRRIDDKTGIESTAGAEGVARADEGNGNGPGGCSPVP